MAPRNRKHSRRGSAMIEMTLIGIPIIFVIISIFEMSRGMWIYHTVAFAAKETARYASVHGINCQQTVNHCAITRAQLAARLRDAALGMDPAQLQTRICINCGAGAIGASDDTGLVTVSSLLTQNLVWPDPTGSGNAMHNRITVEVRYPFRSALAMYFPGRAGVSFNGYIFGSTASETMHF